MISRIENGAYIYIFDGQAIGQLVLNEEIQGY
jgi:hypothetical protein